MKIPTFLSQKLIYRYIIASFGVKLLNTLLFSFFIFFFVDYLTNPGNKLFSIERIGGFLQNIDSLFTFVFFAASSWFLIKFHKTRELMISHTYGISTIEIVRVISYFTLICGVFYLFIFHGPILVFFSKVAGIESGRLQKMPLYTMESDCNYNIILFENLAYQEHIRAFEASKINFFSFKDCTLHKAEALSSSTIRQGDEAKIIEFEGLDALDPTSPSIKISISYNFDVFYKYFLRKIDDTIYKTSYELISNIKEFRQNSIPTRKIEFELYTRLGHTLSFFYSILIAFAFFSSLPPRAAITIRVFNSICAISFFYLVNLIATSYIKKSLVLPPGLMLIPGAIFLFLLFIVIIVKKA